MHSTKVRLWISQKIYNTQKKLKSQWLSTKSRKNRQTKEYKNKFRFLWRANWVSLLINIFLLLYFTFRTSYTVNTLFLSMNRSARKKKNSFLFCASGKRVGILVLLGNVCTFQESKRNWKIFCCAGRMNIETLADIHTEKEEKRFFCTPYSDFVMWEK